LVFTLEFDVKFQLRAMVKRAKDAEKVAIVGQFSEERTKKALNTFVNFLNIVNIPYDVIEVNVHDFQNTVVKVTNYILSHPGKDFLVNLSGGMRLLKFAVLITILLTGVDPRLRVKLRTSQQHTALGSRTYHPCQYL